MSKHKKDPNKKPYVKPKFVVVEGQYVLEADARRARDVAILDKGWNNTEEGRAIIGRANDAKKGKHAK